MKLLQLLASSFKLSLAERKCVNFSECRCGLRQLEELKVSS